LNIPLPLDADYAAWQAAVDTGLERIASSQVQALVIAFGADKFVDDPLDTFTIAKGDYIGIGERIAFQNLPAVIVQEGGYAVEAIERMPWGIKTSG